MNPTPNEAGLMDELARVVLENNQLKRREAAMREALENCDALLAHVRGLSLPSYTALHSARAKLYVALQPKSGARYLSPEQVLPLVEALIAGKQSLLGYNAFCSEINAAIAYAKTLGFNV